jgi:hypothetical protein
VNRTAFLTALACTLLALPALARPTGLTVVKANVAFHDGPNHALTVKGRFPFEDALAGFDPATDVLRITLGDVAVIARDPGPGSGGFRFRRRSWRYRSPGNGRRRVTFDTRTGRFKLKVRKSDQTDLLRAGLRDAPFGIEVGSASDETMIPFAPRGDGTPVRWRHARPPETVLPFTSIVANVIQGASREPVTIARTQPELDAVWAELGSTGFPPRVDFDAEMVVVLAATVRGAGAYPPIISPAEVRYRKGCLEIDWYFAACEEFEQCPGAPGVPCPITTPYHVFRVARVAGEVLTFQQPTVGVCP